MCGNRPPNVFSIAQYKIIWNRLECKKHIFIFNRKIWNTIFKVMVEFPGYILFVTSFGKLAAPPVYPIPLIYFPGETIKTNTPACVPWLCHMVSASWARFHGNFLCVNAVWYEIKHRCILRIVSIYFILGIFFLPKPVKCDARNIWNHVWICIFGVLLNARFYSAIYVLSLKPSQTKISLGRPSVHLSVCRTHIFRSKISGAFQFQFQISCVPEKTCGRQIVESIRLPTNFTNSLA